MIKYTTCPISTHPAKNVTLACYACPYLHISLYIEIIANNFYNFDNPPAFVSVAM